MADQALRRSLAATLAYFDLFEYPLTLAELLRYRYRLPDEPASRAWSAADALAALDDPAFGTRDGYWFLAGRDAAVSTRERRFRLSEPKFARARRVARFLRLLPSVRLVAVCNSLAIANADEESDIDLFVVARPGTLWTTRFVVVAALAALGLRPDEKSHADKVCMSFFVSETAQDLSRCALPPDDTYLRYWAATLVPLYDAGGAFDRFMAANGWIRDRLPGLRRPSRPARGCGAAPRWTAALLPVLKAADAAARRLQLRMFPKEIAAMANIDARVLVSDDILKFHVNDRRAEYERLFKERLRSMEAAREREPAAA
ncbi:MAG TPA: hypothetical protein VLC10_04760 [Patescibacteria group bacterium]|nr:hypothetical protein [Patescibacteria group bacterium]